MVRGPTDPWHTCIYQLYNIFVSGAWADSLVQIWPPVIEGEKKGCSQSKKTHIYPVMMKKMLTNVSWWMADDECFMFPHMIFLKLMHSLNGILFLVLCPGHREWKCDMEIEFSAINSLQTYRYGPCNSTNESLVPALWARRPAWRMRGLWRVASSQDVLFDCSGNLRTQTSEGHCHFFVKRTPSHDFV